MGLILACLSIILAYFSPQQLLPSLAPYHLQLMVILFGVAVSLVTLAARADRELQPPQYLLVLGLWAAVVASHVVRLRFRWGLEGFTNFGTLVAIYFLITVCTSTLGRIKVMVGVLVACAVVMGSQAILAYHTGYLGGQLLLIQPGNPVIVFGNRVRGFGFLHDPNDFAQFLLVSLALLGLFWKKSRSLINFVILGPPAIILVYACYLTFSRGGLLGLAALLFASIYRKGRRVMALVSTGLGIPFLYWLGYTGSRGINPDAGRIMAWGAGIGATIRHPFFGVGFGRFIDINDLTAHNSFLLCAAELGFIGFFFWMALLLTTYIGISALADLEVKTAEDREFASAVYSIRAAFGAFLVTAWFLSRTYTETLYILLALAASLIHLRAYAIPREKTSFRYWASRTIALELISVIAVYLTIKLH